MKNIFQLLDKVIFALVYIQSNNHYGQR